MYLYNYCSWVSTNHEIILGIFLMPGNFRIIVTQLCLICCFILVNAGFKKNATMAHLSNVERKLNNIQIHCGKYMQATCIA